MKKTRFFAIITVAIFVCLISAIGALTVSANEVKEDQVEESDEDIYYTDLFYAYPFYLANNSYLDAYVSDTTGLYELIFSGYEDSAAALGTKIEYAIETATSPQALVSYITEKLGLHSNTYNEAIDTANRVFVEKLLNNDALQEISVQYGEYGSYVNRTKKMVALFNELELKPADSHITRTAEYYLQESFDFLWDRGILSCISESHIAQLWSEINSESFKIGDYLNLASKEIEVAQAFVSALIMADMRMELIDSIIATQPTDTVLRQGMVRLKNQLSGGFVTYFIDNYIKNQVIDSMCTAILKVVSDPTVSLAYNIAAATLNVAKVIAFDWIWKVPSYNSVLAFQVLWCYSNDLNSVMPAKAMSFAEGPFISDKIVEYEDLFSAHIAINKSAIEILKTIAEAEKKGYANEYLNIYKLFTDAQEQGIDIIIVDDGVSKTEMNSNCSQLEVDDMLWKKSKNGIRSITINNGIESKTFNNMAIQYYRAMMRGLEGSGEGFIDFYNREYGDVDLYHEYISHVKKSILETPIEERKVIDKSVYSDWVYTITNDNITLALQSDSVERNCVYAVNDMIRGSILFACKTYTLPEGQMGIDGDLIVDRYTGGNRYVLHNEGNLFISDNLIVGNYSSFINDGEVVVKNSVEFGGTIYNNKVLRTKDFVAYGYFQSATDSQIYISESFSSKGIVYGGELIFNGVEQQNVSGLSAQRIKVENKNGLKYLSNAYLYGEYHLNGNPLDVNDFMTVACDGANFDESNFHKVLFDRTTMTDGVWAEEVFVQGDVVIPNGYNIEIKGNLTVYRWTGWIHHVLHNQGNLTVTGDMYVYDSFINDGEVYLQSDFEGSERTLSGKVVLKGDKAQRVQGLAAEYLDIDNSTEEGVLFITSLTVTVLFNHKENFFKLESGGVFADYDGDGVKDNTDPHPTIVTVEGAVVDDGVAYLGNEVVGCDLLAETVVLRDGTIKIANGAFKNHPNLTSIVIPASVQIIGAEAFRDCLTLEHCEVKGAEEIESYAFYNCQNLILLKLPETLMEIGDGAFSNCISLSDITLSPTLSHLGGRAFENCRNLTNILLPNGLKVIGDYAFSQCSSVTNICIPGSVEKVGHYAFRQCTNLTNVLIENGVKVFGNQVFQGCKSIITLSIPKSVEKIGVGFVSGCVSLIELTVASDSDFYRSVNNCLILKENGTLVAGCNTSVIPDDGTIKIIESLAFAENQFLNEIVIPVGVYKINGGAFSGCYNLTKITLPKTISEIGTLAFSNCRGLTEFVIPGNTINIGKNAFLNCDNLEKIVFENKTGWYVANEEVSSLDLGNSEEARTLLADTYVSFVWLCKTPNYDGFYDQGLQIVSSAFSFDGYQVRKYGDAGIRARFSINRSEDKYQGIEIVEMGCVLAIATEGRSVFDLKLFKQENGQYAVLEKQMLKCIANEDNLFQLSDDDNFHFVCTLYFDDDTTNKAKYTTDIIFRGYVILKINGYECIYYPDMTSDKFEDTVSMYELSSYEMFRDYETSKKVLEVCAQVYEEDYDINMRFDDLLNLKLPTQSVVCLIFVKNKSKFNF